MFETKLKICKSVRTASVSGRPWIIQILSRTVQFNVTHFHRKSCECDVDFHLSALINIATCLQLCGRSRARDNRLWRQRLTEPSSHAQSHRVTHPIHLAIMLNLKAIQTFWFKHNKANKAADAFIMNGAVSSSYRRPVVSRCSSHRQALQCLSFFFDGITSDFHSQGQWQTRICMKLALRLNLSAAFVGCTARGRRLADLITRLLSSHTVRTEARLPQVSFPGIVSHSFPSNFSFQWESNKKDFRRKKIRHVRCQVCSVFHSHANYDDGA